MIGPCVCTTTYFCVSCRVKRGDYTDWTSAPPKPRLKCFVPSCDRMAATVGLCWKHYENRRVVHKRHLAIPMQPYIKLADR